MLNIDFIKLKEGVIFLSTNEIIKKFSLLGV